MRKVALHCLLVFSIALHAQEQGENIILDNSVKNNTEIRTLSVEMGPSWINSKVYTSEGAFKLQAGVELGVEYAGIKVGGFDYGLSFYHNETNIHGCKVSLNYIGPSLIYAHLFHRKWLGKISLGLGVGTAQGNIGVENVLEINKENTGYLEFHKDNRVIEKKQIYHGNF